MQAMGSQHVTKWSVWKYLHAYKQYIYTHLTHISHAHQNALPDQWSRRPLRACDRRKYLSKKISAQNTKSICVRKKRKQSYVWGCERGGKLIILTPLEVLKKMTTDEYCIITQHYSTYHCSNSKIHIFQSKTPPSWEGKAPPWTKDPQRRGQGTVWRKCPVSECVNKN